MRMYTIDERLSRALARRYPKGVPCAAMEMLYESKMETLTVRRTSLADWLFASMAPVGDADTQKSLEAGAGVVALLNNNLDHVEFKYQGSVAANTHIREGSDIDLLVVNKKSFGWDKAGVAKALRIAQMEGETSPDICTKLERVVNMRTYPGNSIDDLTEQTKKCEELLREIYPDIDVSGSRAIGVFDEHLEQRVDVVNCQWYDDVRSIVNGRKCPYRGVKIFNRGTRKFEKADFPFLRIQDMNTRDKETGGRFKQLIRFFKTLRADAVNTDAMSLSSFDIYSIVYSIDPIEYKTCDRRGLAQTLRDYLGKLVADHNAALGIKEFGGDSSLLEGSEEKLRDIETIQSELNLVLTA